MSVRNSDSITESEGKVQIPSGYYQSDVQFTPSSASVGFETLVTYNAE